MKKITTPSRSEVGKKLKTLSCVLPLATALTFSSCDSTPTTLPELKAKWENVKWKELSAKQLKSLVLQVYKVWDGLDREQREEYWAIQDEIELRLQEQEKHELQEKYKKKNLTPEQADQSFLGALENNDIKAFDALLNIGCINDATAEKAFQHCLAVTSVMAEYWNQYDLKNKYPFMLALLQSTNIHISDKIKEEALLLYATEGEQYKGYTIPVIKELLKSWVNINCRDASGNTPLILAAENVWRNHAGYMFADVLEFFLSRKDVDLYAKNKWGRTALEEVYDPELKKLMFRYYN